MRLMLLSAIVLTLIGCSSGKRAFQKGQYDRAVQQAVNRLQSNPDHQKSRTVLKKSYNLALNQHLKVINRLKSDPDPFKWEDILVEYQAVNALHDLIFRCPACLQVVPSPVEYIKEVRTAKANAADAHFDLGKDVLSGNFDRIDAREAHKRFLRAQKLDPTLPELENWIEKAYSEAILAVVVEPIPSPSRVLDIRHTFFENQVNEYLLRQDFNPYLRFFTAAEARQLNLDNPDHLIMMSFENFRLGDIIIREKETEVSKDSVVISKNRNEKKYGTVSATYHTYEKTMVSKAILDFKVVDYHTRRTLISRKFPGEFVWVNRWASYNGDKRALTDDELQLAQKKELPNPPAHTMFTELTKPLYDQIIVEIRTIYRDL